jgi:serine/threonine protein kinase
LHGIFYIWGYGGEIIIKEPTKTSFNSYHEIFAFFNPKITYKTLKSQYTLQIIETLQENKFEYDFKKTLQINSGKKSEILKVVYEFTNKIDAVKRIPMMPERRLRAIEHLKTISSLRNDYFIQYKSVWFENYSSECKEKYKSVLETFLKPDFELLHIKMELCFKSLKDLRVQIQEELKAMTEYEKKLINYFISFEILVEILECLNYLHNQKLTHSNLKPTNILVFNGVNSRFIKLADSMFLNQKKSDPKILDEFEFYDKEYFAPEIDKQKKFDSKADIYSLGKIIPELFDIDINE